MRILIVHNHYQDFGGEDVVFEQERKLLSEQPNISVFTFTFRNKKGFQGLVQFLLSPWNFIAAKKLRRKVKELKPDIIHIHNTQYACGPLVIRAAKKMGVPVVMTLHNFRLLCPSATLFHHGKIFTDSLHENFPWTAVKQKTLDGSWLKTFWTACSYWLHRKIGTWQMVDRYFVLADFSKQLFVTSTLGVPSEKFTVKPNFVIEQKAQPSSSSVQRHFLYIGRLSSEKGILPLLRILQNTSFKLRIAGLGPQQEQVDELVAQNENVVCLGQLSHEQVVKELSECIALIVPSVCYEGGVPLNIIESFLCRTPVLANALGAIDAEIEHGINGCKVDFDDQEAVRAVLERLQNQTPEERSVLTEKAYQMAVQKYNSDTVINILRETYQKLVERNP